MEKKNIFAAAVVVICATVGILYWQLIYEPVRAEIMAMDAETKRIETLEGEIEKLQLRYGNLEDLAALTEERLAQMQEYVPAEMETEKFVAEMYRLSEGKKILINAVQVGEISEKDSVQKQSVRVRLESDYISLLNFIREILDGERLASFESFTIAREGRTNILNCELEFVIFAADLNSGDELR